MNRSLSPLSPAHGPATHPPRLRAWQPAHAPRSEEREAARPPVQKSLRRDAARRAEAEAELRELLSQHPSW